MREDLLHYIWNFKKYPKLGLKTTNGEELEILQSGAHNHFSGPDFFNARARIGNQLWAGNIEIHINASDWYAHHHEKDGSYDNVILHVVWNDDISVFRKDGTEIPTLELKNLIDSRLLNRYNKLMKVHNGQFINCGKDINAVSQFDFKNWQDRLYLERLEEKSKVINKLLQDNNNDWEKVLFVLLLKSFGSKINGEAFFQIGNNLDFSIVRHFINKHLELESLLLGMAGLLESEDIHDPYYRQHQSSFKYLSSKYQLDTRLLTKVAFFKLRPLNFPTIRLSQFAMLYSSSNNLFNELMNCSKEKIYELFRIKSATYWDTHYNFGKVSNKMHKTVSKNFIDLIIINTIIPIRFCYSKYKGEDSSDTILALIESIKEERNSILENFKSLGITVSSALDSQSLLQLYTNYCSKNKCLECAVGANLLNLKS